MTTHEGEPEIDEGLRRLREVPHVRELMSVRPPRRAVEASRSAVGAVGAGCALVFCVPFALFFGLATFVMLGALFSEPAGEAFLMLLVLGTFAAVGVLGTRLALRHLATRRAQSRPVDPDVRHLPARVVGIVRREHGRASIVLRREDGGTRDHEARVGLAAGLTEGDLGVAWLVDDRLVDFVVIVSDEPPIGSAR